MKKSETKPQAVMLDVPAVAEMLDVSQRSIWQWLDSGRLPAPVRLGRLVKFSRATIEKWIADGCPDCARGRRARGRAGA